MFLPTVRSTTNDYTCERPTQYPIRDAVSTCRAGIMVWGRALMDTTGGGTHISTQATASDTPAIPASLSLNNHKRKNMMKTRKLLVTFALGLGLTLALVWLLGSVRVPVAHAATIGVNTFNDATLHDGQCSLREAIFAANKDNTAGGDCASGSGSDVITLSAGTFVLTRTGTGEDAGWTGDLDITDTLTIIGAGPGQTIIDASGLISDRVFHIHSTTGTVVISGVTIINGNIAGFGGGIYNADANLILTNTVISGNSASSNGGGVYVYSGNATLSGGQIFSNTANNGGGVCVRLGGVTLNGEQILSNTANDNGGGVYVVNGNAVFTQTGNSIIAYNTANGGLASNGGGGVYVARGRATLSGGQILSNTANNNGGGVYVYRGRATLSGGQILSNSAGISGGGVYVRLSDGVFTQTGDSAVALNHAAIGGGGVYVYLGGVTMSGGQIVSNTAGNGGGVYVDSGSAALSGGQIFSNIANNNGGGVYVDSGNATLSGGQIFSNTANNSGGGVCVLKSTAAFTQTDVSAITSNFAGNDGGGVYVSQGRAMLSGGQVISNTAVRNGGGFYNLGGALALVNTTASRNRASGTGGGLYVNGGATTLTYTTIASNTATGGEGGIYNVSGVITVQNSIVAHNGVTNCVGALTSTGHNLDSGETCGFAAAGDLTNTNPLLGPLTRDGGALLHPLLVGSPAIDAGICVAGITTDQRGVARPQGATGKCDIGAYEFVLVAPTGVSIDGPAKGLVGAGYVFTATVSPPTATLPLTYTWAPEPDSGQGTSAAAYRWTTPGDRTVTVTVENRGGTVTGTHDILITEYKIYLPLVLRSHP